MDLRQQSGDTRQCDLQRVLETVDRWQERSGSPVPIVTPEPLSRATLAEHGRRVARYAIALGARLGLPDSDLETLRLGGLLHDIGKHAIPGDLLGKSVPLRPDEFEIIKLHTVVGDAMCADVPNLRRVRSIVRHHHERLDGTGYPDGLRGSELPLLVQVVGIVDVFDALGHERAYKPALDVDMVCALLALEADQGWRRPDLVWEFIELVRTPRPVGASRNQPGWTN
jgi:putative two-component system response regulator